MTLVLIEIAAILIVTHILFEYGLILSTSEMLLATSICLVASVVYRFSTAEKRGKLVPSRGGVVRRQAAGLVAG